MAVNINPLKNALGTLIDGYKDAPSDLERDGLIQRFEYSLELCWKMSKKILYENGIEVDAPKSIFRELANLDWIDSAEIWMEFIQARNKASHIYHKEIAEQVFSVIPAFIEHAKNLIKTLEEKSL